MAKKKKSVNAQDHGPGIVYVLGVIGAIVYYVSNATGFWMGVWGVIKSFAWPAIIVFEIMKFLGV